MNKMLHKESDTYMAVKVTIHDCLGECSPERAVVDSD